MRYRTAAVVLAATIGLMGCWEEEEEEAVERGPRPVIAIQVASTSFLGEHSFAGRARASREASLSFRVSGQLIERQVKVGDVVSQGDTIAVLDPGPFQAEVSRLEADLAASKASFDAADEQYGRIMKLVESGTYSDARGDTARGQRDSAAARFDSVRAALVRANLDLSYTVLRAPYDGRTVAVYAENFEEVATKEPIARLLDVSRIEIVIDIPETMIALAPLVDEMAVTFDAFPDVELKGVIEEIGSEASLTTKTYPVTIVMDQPESVLILPGMSGRARTSKVSEPDKASGLVIPASAVRAFDAGSDQLAVWVVDETSKTVSLRPVEVGRILSVGMEVVGGLSAGEWIVTAGTYSLNENDEVLLPTDVAGEG
ncbi:MAG: efflux RND transporter periplasmic adaptor subunit [Boseongicola sp.]